MTDVMTSESKSRERQSTLSDWRSTVRLVSSDTSTHSDAHVLVTVHCDGVSATTHFSTNGVEQVADAHEWCTSWTALAEVPRDLALADVQQVPAVPAPRMTTRGVLLALVALVFIVFASAQWMQLVTVRTVLTGSMKPAINPGDVVVAVSDEYRTPHVGDVVLYVGRRFDGSKVGTFAHRIVGGNARDGWIVKGDANPSEDVQHPTSADIAGVVVATLPAVGKILTPQLFLNIGVGLLVLWFVLKVRAGRV